MRRAVAASIVCSLGALVAPLPHSPPAAPDACGCATAVSGGKMRPLLADEARHGEVVLEVGRRLVSHL
jgi:hypothetical protein